MQEEKQPPSATVLSGAGAAEGPLHSYSLAGSDNFPSLIGPQRAVQIFPAASLTRHRWPFSPCSEVAAKGPLHAEALPTQARDLLSSLGKPSSLTQLILSSKLPAFFSPALSKGVAKYSPCLLIEKKCLPLRGVCWNCEEKQTSRSMHL